MITLLVMTDGRREYLEETLEATENLIGPITRKIIHDDSGSTEYQEWLQNKYGQDYHIHSTGARSGFGGAIRSAWSLIDTEWIFHLEDDFVMLEDLYLNDMISVMDNNPHLYQMALRRQPWNEQETAAGGIIEMDPDSYTEHSDGKNMWIEHRKWFTTNPCLYRKSLTVGHPWPDVKYSEGIFSIDLLKDEKAFGAYWGPKDSQPKCWHIGINRIGMGY